MNNTNINIAEKNREDICKVLNKTLANLSDLSMITKHAHWNLRGPRSYFLHKLFDDLYENLIPLIDEVAERIATLGGLAEGRVANVLKNTSIKSFPEVTKDKEVLEALIESYSSFVNSNRDDVSVVSALEDEATADLLVEVQRKGDKSLWFLEAHF